MKAMSVLDDLIRDGRIANPADLRRAYRRLAKRLHPDSSGALSGAAFVELKADYERALANLANTGAGARGDAGNGAKAANAAARPHTGGASKTGHEGMGGDSRADQGARHQAPPDRDGCRNLFYELIATDFPTDARWASPIHRRRVRDLSFGIAAAGGPPDLVAAAEREALDLRGPSVVSNHPYNLLRLYLNNMADYFCLGNAFSLTYIRQNYRMTADLLAGVGSGRLLALIDWLLADLIVN